MGAIGFAMLTFAINSHVFTHHFIFCRSQTRPLILSQDFCVLHGTGCEWTPHGTKRFTAHHKLILEIEEPEADQFFGVKKSINIPPRHYSITHIQCRDLHEAVMLRPDKSLRRTYLSMWADTYHVDPFKVSADALTQSTANSQVNQTQVDTATTASKGEPDPPVAGAQVGSHTKVRTDATKRVNLGNSVNKEGCHYTVHDIQSVIRHTHICNGSWAICASPGLWDSGELHLPPKGTVLSLALLLVRCLR